MKISVNQPTDLTKSELDSVKELIISGKQVSKENLEERILNCRFLGLCYSDNKLIGVSAIKRPLKSYITGLYDKAKINSNEYPNFELGYSVTSDKFQRMGINRKINDALLETVGKNKILATTDNPVMRKYLESKGFKKIGESFNGNFNETLDYYEL